VGWSPFPFSLRKGIRVSAPDMPVFHPLFN
jgi:hypothetical protein